MTTADYLAQLVKDVESVRTNLNAQGVVTESTDTLTTLAPKIKSIGQDLSTALYMQLYDLVECIEGRALYDVSNYTEEEIAKVDDLLELLGRD